MRLDALLKMYRLSFGLSLYMLLTCFKMVVISSYPFIIILRSPVYIHFVERLAFQCGVLLSLGLNDLGEGRGRLDHEKYVVRLGQTISLALVLH